MKIYTKTGDSGKTSLYDNNRVDKDNIRVESYGTLDELNSFLGLARNYVKDESICQIIINIQRELFNIAGEIATKDISKFPSETNEDKIKVLENIIDRYLEIINKNQEFKFIIPGSNKESATLHVARTICRRAERRILTLSRNEEINMYVLKYINRLSDLIYILARFLESELNYVTFED